MILELRAGVGGTDSRLFVGELFSAYVKYATSKGLEVEVIDHEPGHIVAEVSGPGAFRKFKQETGQHCCQRVPVTERDGRRQTSFISVAVLPVRPEAAKGLNLSECRITPERGRLSAGGQSANKGTRACRARHLPSGIEVFVQNERSAQQNREQAIQILASRVLDHQRNESDAEYAAYKRTKLGDGNRGAKVRTYNFFESRVTDHRNGRKTRDIEAVMRGGFDLLV